MPDNQMKPSSSNVRTPIVSDLTIIVPCYNEEKAVTEVVEALTNSFGNKAQLILIDDGSIDSTGNSLTDLESRLENVDVLSHDSNRGYGASLKTGIVSAKTEYIATIDSDATYSPRQLFEICAYAGDFDMVVGSRTNDDVVYPWLRKIPKFVFRRYCSWLVGQVIPDINSGMRVIRREVALKYLSILPDGFSFTTTITMAMLTNDYKVKFVPVSYADRVGKSKIRPVRDTLNFCQLIVRTGMYFAPMKIFTPAAMLFGMCFSGSLAYDLFYIHDITDKTLIFLLLSVNTTMFALLADMIHKRPHI